MLDASAYGSKSAYKAADFDTDGTPVRFTIAGVEEREFTDSKGIPQVKLTVLVRESSTRYFILGAQQTDSMIAAMQGQTDAEQWVGQPFLAFNDQAISYRGIKGGVRFKEASRVVEATVTPQEKRKEAPGGVPF